MMASSLASFSCTNKMNEQDFVADKDSVNIKLTTNKTIDYWVYNVADYVAGETTLSFDEPFSHNDKHTTFFDGKIVIIDEKTENEQKYKVDHYDFLSGKVFKDDGFQERYTIMAKPINEDGSVDEYFTVISIIKVKAQKGTQNIVKIYPLDDISSVTVYTD